LKEGAYKKVDKGNIKSNIIFGILLVILMAFFVKASLSNPAGSISSGGDCTDSDVTGSYPIGINPYKVGTTNNSNGTSVDDFCASSRYVLEYYCTSQDELSSTYIDCGNFDSHGKDYFCSFGKCVGSVPI
jgi:hypothetical protein